MIYQGYYLFRTICVIFHADFMYSTVQSEIRPIVFFYEQFHCEIVLIYLFVTFYITWEEGGILSVGV